jgi:hypothetical protein
VKFTLFACATARAAISAVCDQQTANLFILFCNRRKEDDIMKQKKLSLVFLIGALVLVASCVPLYEMMIQGEWEVDEYYKNGEDETQEFYFAFADYVIIFHPDGYFTEMYMGLNVIPVINSGSWSFINNAQQLSLEDEGSTRIYDIRSLKKTEMRLYRDLGEGEYEELVLEPKEEI